MKSKKLIWEKGKQRAIVLIEVDKKVYQVALDESQENSLIFILPQLFDGHSIKILPEKIPIIIPPREAVKEN